MMVAVILGISNLESNFVTKPFTIHSTCLLIKGPCWHLICSAVSNQFSCEAQVYPWALACFESIAC